MLQNFSHVALRTTYLASSWLICSGSPLKDLPTEQWREDAWETLLTLLLCCSAARFHCCELLNGWAPGEDAWERLPGRQPGQMQEAVMGPRIRKNGVKDERMRVQQVDLQLAAVLCLLTSQNARLHEKLAEAGRLSKLVLEYLRQS